MRHFLIPVLLAAAGFGGAVQAETTATDLTMVTTQQEQLRELVLAKKGRFASLSPAKRKELLDRQSDLLELIDGKSTTDDLSMEERIRAFNDLEWIRAVVNDTPMGDIVVCSRGRRTGSHMNTTNCMTQRELRQIEQVTESIMAVHGQPVRSGL